MIEILLVIAVSAVLLVYWAEIMDIFQKNIIPWCRGKISSSVVDSIADFISFCDNGVCWTKRQIKEAWQTFKENILGVKDEYEKISPTEATRKRTVYAKADNGDVYRQVTEDKIPYEDLPADVRKEMMRQNTPKASLDIKELVRQKAIKTAKNNEIELVLEV